MASIKQPQTRNYKVTVSNWYRPDGKKSAVPSPSAACGPSTRRTYWWSCGSEPVTEKTVQETTVQKYLTVVSAVLSDAKRNEILEKNPSRMAALPQSQRSIQRVPTQVEVQKLLDALAREPRHYPPCIPAAAVANCAPCNGANGATSTGQCSIHILRNVVKVTDEEIFTKAPKTVSGDRYVFLSLEMDSLLREYRQECAWEMESYDSRELEDGDFLFRRKGCPLPMTPFTFTCRFKLILKKYGLPGYLNVHSLQHTNASLSSRTVRMWPKPALHHVEHLHPCV